MNPPPKVVQQAISQAQRSRCRSQRGAAIWLPTNDEHVIGIGYNALPAGTCDASDRCKASCSRFAIHAEQQALLYAAALGNGQRIRGASMLHVKIINGLLVPSGPPSCIECAKLILGSAIAFMWILHDNGWQRYPTTTFHSLSLPPT